MSTLALRHVHARGRAGFWPLVGALTFVLVLASAASAPVGNAAFPGANGKIAFVRNGEIYVMNSDGTGQTNLTTIAGPGGDDTPAWSPDGTKIAFTSDIGNQEIYVMDADGSGQTNLTQNAASDRQPTWSPDGTKIAFLSNRSGDFEIWSMNANGSSPTNLTMTPGIQEDPAWAPDNTRIAYRQPVDLFAMNPDGTNQALFPLAIGPSVSQPDWSPDAQKIAFTGDIPAVSTHIYVVNADATGVVTQLTLAGQGLNFVPAYSPDGTKIAFTSNRDGNYEIYSMNANGTGQINLTQNTSNDTSPDWGVDAMPPVVNVSFPSPNGQNGWFVTSPVTGSVVANDTTTGGNNVTAITCTGATVGSITGLGTPSASAPLTVSAEGVSNVSCTATDSAGNSGAASGSSNTATVKIDSVAPGISITSPANGGTFLLNAAVASSYSCDDATSGVATCTGPVVSGANFSTSPVGAHAFRVDAADVAGNPAQATNTYNVVYAFSGFFQPVDNPGPGPSFVFNSAKAGSAIPVKFSLGGDQGLSIFAPGYPKSQPIYCDASATYDGIEETVTAGSSSLSYDATTDRYHYVWKTDKAWANTCRKLTVRLNDSTDHVAYFNFKK